MFDFDMPPLDWRKARIPKKRKGEFRELTIPNDALKEVQRNILYFLYSCRNIKVATFAHGFVPKRSIYTEVKAHSIESPIYLCMDCHKFFDTFPVEPVRRKLLSGHLSHYLVEKILKVCTYEGHFPQGSPTSPFLTNIGMFDIDCMIRSFCKKHGFLYTRYADDIVLSCIDVNKVPKNTRRIFQCIDLILRQHLGIRLAQEKSHVIHRGSPDKPQILGIIVRKDGKGYNAPKRKRHKVRAGLHNLANKLLQQKGVPTNEDRMMFNKLYGYVVFSDYVRSQSEVENGADPHYGEDDFNYLCSIFRKVKQ